MAQTKERKIEVLKQIRADIKSDMENFYGQPFNGRTVGIQLGHQAAAITYLANVLQSELEKN